MPLKTLCARLLVNMLAISVAEYVVRRVGLEMRRRKACENRLSTEFLCWNMIIVSKKV